MVVGIIGAGPAGCYTAEHLRWDKAIVFEKKPLSGTPVQCTGIVTKSILKQIDTLPDSVCINNITRFQIHSPSKETCIVPLTKPDIILNRTAFDRHLAKRASQKHPIKYNHALVGWKEKKDTANRSEDNPQGKSYTLKFANGATHHVDKIIGADGPMSPVARHANVYGQRSFVTGFQVRAEIKQPEQAFDPETTQVFLGKGEFAYIVPENKRIARIGILGKSSDELRREFQSLCKGYRPLEHQHGICPMYDPKLPIQNDTVALVGDAAMQVKATTYGGIIYGMTAAQLLGKSWSKYQERCKRAFGRDLWLSNRIRGALNKLTQKDYTDMVRIVKNGPVQNILSSSDRNYPTRFLLKLLLHEPRLWKYGFKVLF